MDWKDALGSLLDSGTLPQGEPDHNPAPGDAAPQSPGIQKSPLHVFVERKGRGGKTATIITDFAGSEDDLRELAQQLKRKLGTGGSARGGEILIQGDRADEVRTLLRSLGYKAK